MLCVHVLGCMHTVWGGSPPACIDAWRKLLIVSACPHCSLPSPAAGTFRLTCIQWWGQNDASLLAKTYCCQSTNREASFKSRRMSLANQSRRTSCSTSVATRISISLSIRWGSASSCTRFWSTIQIAASVPTRGDPARTS